VLCCAKKCAYLAMNVCGVDWYRKRPASERMHVGAKTGWEGEGEE